MAEYPFQPMVTIYVSNKTILTSLVFHCVIGRYPDTEYIVDITLVGEEVGGVFWEDAVFVDSEKEVSIGRCRGGCP